ncbi:MAG: hypothetical protein ACRDON_07380 [Gaiellaceae bacterium]
MATAMLLEWEGVTQADYDRVNDALNLGDNPIEGLILHTAGPGPSGWRVFDIWESQEAFGRFVEERLMSAINDAGLSEQSQPDPQLYQLYNVYAPAAAELGQIGATALSGDRARV